MKKYIIVLLALLIFSCKEDDNNVESDVGWFKINGKNIGNEDMLGNLIIYDEKHIVMTAEFNGEDQSYKKVLESFDGGRNWSIRIDLGEYGVIGYYDDIIFDTYTYFFKNLIIMSNGNEFIYLKSNENFMYIGSIDRFSLSIYFSHFDVDSKNNLYFSSNFGIHKSDNDFQSIVTLDTTLNRYFDAGESPLNSVDYLDFINEDLAYFIDFEENKLYKTLDRCKTFESIDFDCSFLVANNKSVRTRPKIIFYNEVVYQLKADGLYKSVDSGKSFTNIYPISVGINTSQIKSLNEETLYFLWADENNNTELLVTIDGGISFTKQEFPEGINIIDFNFTDTNIGYAVGLNGALFKTNNGGFKDK